MEKGEGEGRGNENPGYGPGITTSKDTKTFILRF